MGSPGPRPNEPETTRYLKLIGPAAGSGSGACCCDGGAQGRFLALYNAPDYGARRLAAGDRPATRTICQIWNRTGMDHLDSLEAESVYILREAFAKLERLAILWSLGKDSNVVLWLTRKAFLGHVPLPVLHVDTGKKFKEMYAFRERYATEWGLKLLVEPCPPLEQMDPTLPPAARSAARKTAGLNGALAKHGFQGLIAGIRRDEEGTRAKERYFSPRTKDNRWDLKDQPPEFWNQYMTSFPPGTHVRVHPLLHWSEVDIWRYTRREGIPLIDLYFAKDGMRYRSLGDEDITSPVASTAATLDEIIAELETTRVAERSGRAMDHEAEDAFERLRAEGYM